jgi:hypothetical protein
VSRELFEDALPINLIYNYSHWVDLDSMELHFRSSSFDEPKFHETSLCVLDVFLSLETRPHSNYGFLLDYSDLFIGYIGIQATLGSLSAARFANEGLDGCSSAFYDRTSNVRANFSHDWTI